MIGSSFRVVDVGCPSLCAGCWTQGLVDAVIDMPQFEGGGGFDNCGLGGEAFHLDFELPSTWGKLLAYVGAFGKFDFAISTHVIEDHKPPRFAIYEFLKVLEIIENIFLMFLDVFAN